MGMKTFILMVVSFSIISCADPKELYDAGYGDGFAVGYNTTCEIRTTLVEGHWENKDYARGYRIGNEAGSLACIRDKRNNSVK